MSSEDRKKTKTPVLPYRNKAEAGKDIGVWPEPFKPQPRLFALLLLGWAAWMAALLMLYFKVAYPNHL
jgi:hypothetical protein